MNRFALTLLCGVFSVLAGPAHAADVTAGQQIYMQYCVGCHGVGGQAVLPNAPHFSRGDRLMQPDTMLMMSIRAGKQSMPSFNGILRDQQILDVIAYLRTLQR